MTIKRKICNNSQFDNFKNRCSSNKSIFCLKFLLLLLLPAEFLGIWHKMLPEKLNLTLPKSAKLLIFQLNFPN